MKTEKTIVIDEETAVAIWNCVGAASQAGVIDVNSDIYMKIWNAVRVAIPSIRIGSPKIGEEHLY